MHVTTSFAELFLLAFPILASCNTILFTKKKKSFLNLDLKGRIQTVKQCSGFKLLRVYLGTGPFLIVYSVRSNKNVRVTTQKCRIS